jgi:hypothetical protein
MKIPEIFRPEKNLENKTNELTKGYKPLKREEPINMSVQDIVRIGERVAEKFGKFGMESYKFKDKETNLKIKYTPGCWPETLGSLKVYLKKSFFKKEKVFEFSRDYKEPLLAYFPGEWEKDLEKLYSKA